ncbi:MAG: tetratricopeptide repeat protein [Candidatus Obscuribacterales bacterium]
MTQQELAVLGGKGAFRIGYAFHAQKYVAIKITKWGRQEYEFQQRLAQLPNLLSARDCCETISPKQEKVTYQVMDLAGLGNLHRLCPSIVSLTDPIFREHLQFYISRSLLLGLHSMHAEGCYHLDFKLQNGVVTREGEVKLIDFGCAQASPTGQIDCSRLWTDPDYHPPEQWFAGYSDLDTFQSGAKIDAWAAGVAMLELFKGIPDFFESSKIINGEKTQKVILHHFSTKLLEIPELFDPNPEGPWAVISRLLELAPAKRITIEQALDLPWFVHTMTTFNPVREKTLLHLIELAQTHPFEQLLTRGERKLIIPDYDLSSQKGDLGLSPQYPPLPHFTDYVTRDQLETQIKGHLFSGKGQTTLCGIGGGGKSQLALYLFHSKEVREHFGIRLWFRGCSRRSSLDSQFQVLAAELGLIGGRSTPGEAVAAVHRYLSIQKQPYLIVFDNAEEPEILQPYLPSSNGHLLLTAHHDAWSNRIEIGVLSEEESETLIRGLLQKSDPDSSRLAKSLEHLPLAIVQACAFIRAHSLSVSEYLGLLKRCESQLLQQSESLFGKSLPVPVGSVWETTFTTLHETCPEALLLLDTIAYLAPVNIPETLMMQLSQHQRLPIESLRKYALVGQSGGSYSTHRLILVNRKSRHNATLRGSCLVAALEALTRATDPPQLCKEQARLFLLHGTALDEKLAHSKLPSGHATQLLMQAFCLWMGKCHTALQEYPGERAYYERYLEACVELEDQAGEGAAYGYLGNAHYSIGDYPKAIGCHNKRLHIMTKRRDQAGMGHANANLGAAYNRLGKHEKALGCHKKAFQIAFQLNDRAGTGRAYRGLGISYIGLQKPALALECLINYLEIAIALKDEDAQGKAHRDIGLAHHSSGDYPSALYHLKLSLQIACKIGDKAGEGSAYGNLGIVFDSLGDYNKAVEYHEKHLQIARMLSDQDGKGRACCNLGNAHHRLGNYHMAIRYHKKDLKIAIKFKDKAGQMVAAGNLGSSYCSLNNYDMAIKYYKEHLKIARELKDKSEEMRAENNLLYVKAQPKPTHSSPQEDCVIM